MDENKTTLTAPEGVQLDAAYVIAKIDQIMEDSKNLRKTLELLENRPMNGEAVIASGI